MLLLKLYTAGPSFSLSLNSAIDHALSSLYQYYSCGLSTATIEYSCRSVCLSVCLGVCVCVCVCVCLSVYMITKKNDGSILLKLEHIVVGLYG